jgi:hypothetical protein
MERDLKRPLYRGSAYILLFLPYSRSLDPFLHVFIQEGCSYEFHKTIVQVAIDKGVVGAAPEPHLIGERGFVGMYYGLRDRARGMLVPKPPFIKRTKDDND